MFLWGAEFGHLYQWFANGDHAPGNTGGVLVYDLLIPAVMIILARRSRDTGEVVRNREAGVVGARLA